jgi:hypothetical protein
VHSRARAKRSKTTMCRLRAARGLAGIVWFFVLGALYFSAEYPAKAELRPYYSIRPVLSASPFIVEVRHRYRRHRRALAKREQQEDEQSISAGGGNAAKSEVQGPPPPAPSGKAIASPEKSKEAAPAKDEAAAKPAEPQGPPPPPDTWPAAEVQAARSDCDRRLSGLHAIFDRLEPIKEVACGSPSPLRLKGFENGTQHELEFSPPPTISCKLTEALKRWFDDVVQPKAKAHLNATIVRVTNLQAYNCRSRYNDATQRLSQHAYANAIDVSEFITAKGEHIGVLDHWSSGDERSAFLRDIHDGACQIFGTTLGPEANEAHKNHFHLDMTERRRPLCDFTPAQLRAREEAKKHPVEPASTAAKVLASGGAAAVDSTAGEEPAHAKAETPSATAKPEVKAAANEHAAEERRNHHRRRRSHRHALF